MCKRPRISCQRSTTSQRPDDTIVVIGPDKNHTILWFFERKWVLLTVGSVLVFLLMLLTVALVVYCALSRRTHKTHKRNKIDTKTSPERNSDRVSDSSDRD